MEAKGALDKQSAPKPAGKGERGAFSGASVGTCSAATQAHLYGKEGTAWCLQGEAPTPGTSAKPAPTSHQQLEPGKPRGVTLALRFLPLHLDKVGVGAKTSGSGECPFGDVRSPSTAPPVPPQLPRARCLRGRVPDALHKLRCAAPVRPHLPTHRPARSGAPQPGAQGPANCWGPRPNGPSTSLGSL